MQSFAEQVKTIKDTLRARIFRAEWSPGDPVDKDRVRSEFQASVRAVRVALTELAREGLLLRKRHIGTFVSSDLPTTFMAVLPQLHTVGLLSALSYERFTALPSMQRVVGGIRSAMQPPAQLSLFLNPDGTHATIADPPPVVPGRIDRKLQGFLSLELCNAPFLNDLSRAGHSVVALDFAPAGHLFDAVQMDHQAAGYLATTQLLALGHRRIAYLGEGANGQSMDPVWQDRLVGYLRAMAEAGGDGSAPWVCDVQRVLQRAPERLPPFHRRHRPTAYVLAVGTWYETVRRLLQEMGEAVPSRVSLCSADASVREGDLPELSSVRADLAHVGTQMVRLLASRLACRAMPAVELKVPVTFKACSSTAPPSPAAAG